MKKFKRIFVFLLSFCCLLTTVMNSSLTTVSAANPQVSVTIEGNGGTYDISGSGATMTGTEYQWHEQSIDVGSSLAASDITISDPVSANGWTFNCWEALDNTNPSNPIPLEGGALTTQEMLNYTIPNHDILFMACWDSSTGNGGGNTGGNQGSSQAEVMLYADGGNFGFTMPDGTGNATNWGNFWVTSGNSLKDDNYTITDAAKRGFIFKGWMECTYTVDSSTNMPICTPVAGAALRSTADVMNLTVPSTGIAFIAQYDVDTRTYVNVFFDGNGGTFTFDKNGFVQNGCEGYGDNYPVGSTVAAEEPNLTFTNPIYWDSTRAFTGWLAFERVERTNANGNTYMSLEQIAGTGLMTTAQAFGFTIPDSELVFKAQYAGNDDDYNSQVYINGYGAQFTYDEYYWMNNQQQTTTRSSEGWGRYLREDGTSIATQCQDFFVFKDEPSKSDANFEGWLEFKVETKTNKLGNEYEDYTLVSQTLLSTNDMLNRAVPSYDVAYVAKWSNMDFDDYYQWINTTNVGFSAEPGRFYFADPAHGLTGEYVNGANWGYEKGETLASLGVVVKDPTATGYIFKGWKVCNVEFTPNGPVFTQIPNTSLITTTDALNYVIPDYNIFFVAEWEADTRPVVKVSFDANDGEMTVTNQANSWNTSYYGNDYLVGSKVSDTDVTIKDPVFWNSQRAFEGWKVYQEVETTDVEGNPHFILKPVAGTSILTTAQALAYEIPNYDIVFKAQYAGKDDDYYSNVSINGYGYSFTFDNTYWNNGQQVTETITTQGWGNYLREDGTSIDTQCKEYFSFVAEPSRSDATLEGWLEFKVEYKERYDGEWFEDYTLVSNTLYTTAEILARPIPAYDVAYVAKWSDIPTEEYFAKNKIFFLNGNGGEISFKVLEDGHIETTPVNGVGYLNCYTLEEGLNKAGISFEGVHKQCTVLSGWTIYEFDDFEWVEVPAGQELTVGDPDVTFVHWITNVDENGNELTDVYLGMINAKLQFGYASTGQLLTFESGKHNLAVANWQEAHTAAPFVQENIVEPAEGKDGSYDKVVYCSVCHEELDRETIITTFTSQEVKVEGSDDSYKADTKSALTEVPEEIAEQYTSVADIEKALEDTATTKNNKLDDEKVQIEVVDVELKIFNEETNTWELVDDENFPENGVTIVLPYPAGTNSVNFANYTFEIVHMITSGDKVGQTELLVPVFKADGIHVTVTSLSPIGIVYQENPKAPAISIPPSVESEHTLANGEEVRMITLKNNSNIYVIGNRNLVPQGGSFECNELSSGTHFEAVAKLIAKKFGSADFKVFDMNLFNANDERINKLNGTINVTLPIPEGMVTREGDSIIVYRVENGKLIKCDTAVANDQVTFATNHFSTYVLVEINSMTSPKTGDDTMMPMYTIIMLFAFAATAVSMKKRFSI